VSGVWYPIRSIGTTLQDGTDAGREGDILLS